MSLTTKIVYLRKYQMRKMTETGTCWQDSCMVVDAGLMLATVFVRLMTGALPSGAHMSLLLLLVTQQVLFGL